MMESLHRRDLVKMVGGAALGAAVPCAAAAQLPDLHLPGLMTRRDQVTTVDQSTPRQVFAGRVAEQELPARVVRYGSGFYAIPVSWSGILPSGSHTMLYVFKVVAQPLGRSGIFETTVSSAAVNFLPPPGHMHLVNAVIGPVSDSIKGVNYQGLFGFDPHQFLDRHPILQLPPNFPVDVAMPVAVTDKVYRAVIARSRELTASGRYYVTAPYSAASNVCNCIGALKGVMKHLETANPDRELDTGLMYGRVATDCVMNWLLSAAGIAPGRNGVYGTTDDDKMWGLLRKALDGGQPRLSLRHARVYRLSR